MADNDLDKYLENLGISTEEEPVAESGIPDEVEDFGAPVLMPGVVQGDVEARLESFLVNLLLNFDPAYAVEITRADDEEIDIEIFGGDPGKIIGRNGRTLQALEYITNTVINRGEEGRGVRISIDVGGYKRRRDERLRTEARKAAGRVRKTGMAVEFEPMSAAERRVIHVELADDPSVVSESSGEGKNRRVVVKPS